MTTFLVRLEGGETNLSGFGKWLKKLSLPAPRVWRSAASGDRSQSGLFWSADGPSSAARGMTSENANISWSTGPGGLRDLGSFPWLFPFRNSHSELRIPCRSGGALRVGTTRGPAGWERGRRCSACFQRAGGLGIPAQVCRAAHHKSGEQGCSPNPQAGMPALRATRHSPRPALHRQLESRRLRPETRRGMTHQLGIKS
jgi:hypothetical protein